MSQCNSKPSARPTSLICECGTPVQVKERGRIPMQCEPCGEKRRRAQSRGEDVPPPRPRKIYYADGDEALGPEEPQYGMSAMNYAQWKARRVVQLYREEPELSVQVIAERLDVSTHHVQTLLNRAGIHCRGDGRAQLASGPPL